MAELSNVVHMKPMSAMINMMYDVPKLRKHVDGRLIGLRTDRYSWWLHWREIADYMLPRRYRWLVTANQMNRGSPINSRIIDSTASLAWRDCASGMMAGITSPARPWFRLSLEDDDLSEQSDVRLWLDEVSRRILHVMSKSNYYQSKHTQYGDLAAFGTAPLIIYEDFEDVIRCFNPCAGEYFVATSERLAIDTIYREFTMTVQQMVEKWGIDNVSTDVAQSYTNGGANLVREKIICHAIEPNTDQIKGIPGLKGMAYREVYWEQGSDANKVLECCGYEEKPFSAPRWDTSGNDAYGRCPAMDALGDIKQLQVEQKRKAQAIDKMVNPPLIGNVALKNEPVTSLPGGITYTPTTVETGLKPIYEVKPELHHMVEDIKEVQGRIERVFFKDLWLMISQLDTVRTAAEIAARKEEKMIMLGPVLERFHNESLDQDIDRIFAIMWRAGLLPKDVPQSLKGQMIKVEYTSILAQAQRAVMTTGIERLVAFVGNIAAGQEGKGQHPDVLDNLDWDKIIDKYAGMLGVDSSVVVPYAKVVRIRAARAQAQQASMMQQQAMAAVQGAKVLSETDVGGGQNALQRMIA